MQQRREETQVKIKIKNLRLRTIIGIYEWEKKTVQDVIINIEIDFDGKKAGKTDQIEDTVDYKKVTKEIIRIVESNSYNLVEKLASDVMNLIMEDHKVLQCQVEIDKPGALRFTDSVSIQINQSR